jgi:hypothetical protein
LLSFLFIKKIFEYTTGSYRIRCAHDSFTLEGLPADVQLLIIRNMDLQTLQSVTQVISSAKELYLMYPSGILQGALAFLAPQIRNLLLTIHSLAGTIKHPGIFLAPDLTNVDLFLAVNLDADEPKKIELLEYDPMGALHGLCELMADVGGLVQDYAAAMYNRACYHGDCAAVTPLSLSSVELRRVTRATYRLKLFGMLFYNDLRHSAVSSPSSFKTFFD